MSSLKTATDLLQRHYRDVVEPQLVADHGVVTLRDGLNKRAPDLDPSQRYVRLELRPNLSVAMGVGQDAPERLVGLWMLTCMVPLRSGTAAFDLANAAAGHYRRLTLNQVLDAGREDLSIADLQTPNQHHEVVVAVPWTLYEGQPTTGGIVTLQ